MINTEKRTQIRAYRYENIRIFLKYVRVRPSMLLGIILTCIYVAIALLDIFYPRYLGVTSAGTLWSFTNLSLTSTVTPTPPTLANGWENIFGTTSYGLPIFPVMLAAIATDIKYSFLVVSVSAILGTFAGIFSAIFSRRTDLIFMRMTDIFLSFPAIIVVIIFASIEGWSYLNISYGILLIWWTTYARVARGATLPLRRSTFVEAAIASGCSRFQLIRKHIFPNVMSLIFVQITLDIGMVISIFATVNFLFSSLNITNAFVPEIGNMMVGFPEAGVIVNPNFYASFPVSSSLLLISGTWWPIVIPGLFLIIFIVGMNLMGNGLRDFVNPRNRGR